MNRVRITAALVFLGAMLGLASCGGGAGAGMQTIKPGPPGNPVPILGAVIPQNVRAGSAADADEEVTGSDFIPGSVVRWNGSDRTTTFQDNNALRFYLMPGDLAQPGNFPITVFNPSPGGGTSAPFTFTVTPAISAQPVLTSISPSVLYAGSGITTLTANGSNFISESFIQVDENNQSTTFISDSQLQTELFVSGYAGQLQVDVFTVPPGGGNSATIVLPIIPGATPVGTIDAASVATDGSLSNRESRHPAITPDGRYIAFDSVGYNLVPGGTNGYAQIFVRDTCFGVASDCSPTTSLISTASDGSQANNDSFAPSLSADGRFVAFESMATNLTPGTTGDLLQVFLHDRDVAQTGNFDQAGNTANYLISIGMTGSASDKGAADQSMSANGRYVAFSSVSDDLVPGDTNDAEDVFVRDTCQTAPPGCTPQTIRVSVATDGSQTGENSYNASPHLSADGRYVAFDSSSGTLVPGFQLGGVFLRDTCISAPPGCSPTTQGVSLSASGNPSFAAQNAISADGRFAAFVSSGLTPDSLQVQNVYVRDTCLGQASGCTPTTRNVSVGSGGTEANGESFFPAISPDGRYVAFTSAATNIAANNAHDTNQDPDYLVHDTCLGVPAGCTPTTYQVSVSNDGRQSQGNEGTDTPPILQISANGRVIVFTSYATNLLAAPTDSELIYRVLTNFP